MKITVALLFGGRGEEHAVSCRSAAAVYRHLDAERYRILPIGIDRGGDFFLCRTEDPSRIFLADFRKQADILLPTFPVRLGARKGFFCADGILPVDVALPVLHGRGGEDGEVQGLLAAAGIPFVGCDAVASAACFDKDFTKQIAAAADIPTARGMALSGEQALAEAQSLVYSVFSPDERLFLKPARQGSSFGTSIARCKEEFAKCYDLARAYGKVLVEEYIENKTELEVAFLEREGEMLFSGPGEIFSGEAMYSYKEKYEGGMAASVRAKIPESIRARILDYAKTLVCALSLRGLSRIDFFLTPEGRICFNEVNTLPGFTESSLYPALWEAEGLCFSSLLDILIGEALARAS